MIGNLRKKFILVAMCSTFVVLFSIMGVVNVANYVKIVNRADSLTEMIGENNGQVPPWMSEDGKEKQKELKEIPKHREREEFSPETPYETRFFLVTLNREGEVVEQDMEKIAAIDQNRAESYARKIYKGNSNKGYVDVYRYRKIETGENIKIIFVDCHKDMESFRTLLITSTTVSVLGLFLVFILVLFFSKIVFRPVAAAYDRQKQFITDASHEIKTPLTIIDANTQVLEMENGESQWTASIQKQVKRLSGLTQQMVTLSRLEEQKGGEKVKFSLSDAVYESVQPFEALAITKGQKVSLQIEENLYFLGEEQLIRQLVGIFMDNAVKYTPAHGEICISLKKKGKKSQLQVWNQTDAVPQGKLDILLERFYRLDDSHNSETGGSGIGLSVAQAITDSQKGKITIYSEDGRSLTVTVIL